MDGTPYGETWIEHSKPSDFNLPYKFTGKELDEETGLYYYGARYLDPKTSRWLSTDPALGEYIPQAGAGSEDLPGVGGIFNQVNFHVYHYAGNNPVKYVDPDGRTAEYTIDEANKTATIDVDITIWGDDATDALAQQYEDNITGMWGADSNGDPWQMNINGEDYVVTLNVNVTADKKLGSVGAFFKSLWNLFFGTKNYMKADKNVIRSGVWAGFTGSWRIIGRDGRPFDVSQDKMPAHEFGHMLGLKDRYSDGSGRHAGWERNIMGDSSGGFLEERNMLLFTACRLCDAF